jgi:hypothetical protein
MAPELMPASKPEPDSSGTLNHPQRPDLARLGCWYGVSFIVSLVATLAIVRAALAHPSEHLSRHYLVVWATCSGGSLLLASLLGGLFALRRETPIRMAVPWSLLVGPAVAVGYLFGVSGQMDAGSALCDAPAAGSCDTEWGFGAVAIAVVAGLVLGAVFSAAFALRRLGDRRAAVAAAARNRCERLPVLRGSPEEKRRRM